jgi:hypothetical protein
LTTKNKILKILIYLSGIFSLFIFIVLRLNNEPVYLMDRKFAESASSFVYGDLYILNLVENFNTATPPVYPSYIKSEKQPKINEADILTFGDSFFAGGARRKHFPERLSDTLHKKVFFMDSSDPLTILNDSNYQNKNAKYLIFEIAERRIPEVFSKKHSAVSRNRQYFSSILNIIYPYNLELKYTFLLQRGLVSHFIYKELATFKFNSFGFISSITPAYIENPPWLFYYQEINNKSTSFYYKFTDEEIKTICNNRVDLSAQLKEKYNLDLLLLPIPNKYTIYHKLLNNDEYNNFLPRIYAELEKRNVKICEVYDSFMKSNKILYYPTDTHWNDEGVNVTMTELIKTLNMNK